MKTKDQTIVAWSLIVFGGLMVLFNSLDLNFSSFIIPLIFVGGGWWLIVKSPSTSFLDNPTIKFIAEINFDENWEVRNENILAITGEFNVDFRGVILPEGESSLQYTCISGEIDARIPENFPVKITANAISVDSKFDGLKKEYIFSGYQYITDTFEQASNRISITINSIASEIDITQY